MQNGDRQFRGDGAALEGLISLLVELSRSARQPVERHAARRMLIEAQSAWPGEFEKQWWKWVIEAGKTLGLSLRATDITLPGAVNLAASHVPAATCWSDSEDSWLVLSNAPGIHLHVTSGRLGGLPKPVVTDRVEHYLKDLKSTVSQRWVVVETHDEMVSSDPHHHMTPRQRMWALLKPEWNDIWVVWVVALFVGMLATAVPIAAQQLVRTVTFGTLYQPIMVLSLVLFGFLTFMAGLQALNIVIAELVQQRLFARITADLSYRLPRVRHDVADSQSLPELVNRFMEVVTAQKVIGGLLVDGMAVLLTTVIGMSLLAFYHPFLLGYDVILLAMMLFVIIVVGRGGTRTAIQESISKYRTLAWLEDVGRCLVSFKMYGASDFSVDRADRLAADYLTHRQAHFRVLVRQVLCILGLQAIASAVLLGLGGYLVVREQLTLGQLVAAELVISMIVGSFAKLIKHIEGYYDLMAAMDKLGHLFDLPMETQRGLMSMPGGQAAELDVRHLSVAAPHAHGHGHGHGEEQEDDGYAHGVHTVIDHLSFRVASGDSLAVVGPAGSGKTLLLDTLYELIRPTNGAVMFDGVDITDIRPDVLRRHMVLLRQPEIIEGTVSDNVHFSRPDVDTADVREALTVAGLIDEIRYLPRGIETEISVTGRPLSDSQITRLMLARALAGHPRLILIDGLLDRLSDDMLVELWDRLQNLSWRPTLVLVTGRRLLQELCDDVLHLEAAHHDHQHDHDHDREHIDDPTGSRRLSPPDAQAGDYRSRM